PGVGLNVRGVDAADVVCAEAVDQGAR
ncbi:MAG: hypothetical protein RL706_815, partial [Pseudomonadota bacterium]